MSLTNLGLLPPFCHACNKVSVKRGTGVGGHRGKENGASKMGMQMFRYMRQNGA